MLFGVRLFFFTPLSKTNNFGSKRFMSDQKYFFSE